MKKLTHYEKLDYLVGELCDEFVQKQGMRIEKVDRRTVLRTLMNIRMPRTMSEEFLQIQDEFLREEAEEKGIIRLEDIPTIRKQYGSENAYSDKISIWQGDITRLKVDAIVNAANSQMLGCFVPCHNCIDNAIHSSAGLQLREECNDYMHKHKMKNSFYEEPTGSAVVTKGYNLPCNYVIHTVGPIVSDCLTESLKEDLRSCYNSCMKEALENGIRSIAFCCISTGEFHFPNDEAAKIVVQEVNNVLKDHSEQIDRVIFNVFKDVDFKIYEGLLVETRKLI